MAAGDLGERMTERHCACGCGERLEGMRADAVYASAACRTRDWKRRKGITGIRYTKASQNGKSGPSGLQVSFRKAVETLHLELRLPRLAIQSALEPALSKRQRRQLFEKEANP
jgi:hypothetical protein